VVALELLWCSGKVGLIEVVSSGTEDQSYKELGDRLLLTLNLTVQ